MEEPSVDLPLTSMLSRGKTLTLYLISTSQFTVHSSQFTVHSSQVNFTVSDEVITIEDYCTSVLLS